MMFNTPAINSRIATKAARPIPLAMAELFPGVGRTALPGDGHRPEPRERRTRRHHPMQVISNRVRVVPIASVPSACDGPHGAVPRNDGVSAVGSSVGSNAAQHDRIEQNAEMKNRLCCSDFRFVGHTGKMRATLHTREVAGSKPAVPIAGGVPWNWVPSGSHQTGLRRDRLGSVWHRGSLRAPPQLVPPRDGTLTRWSLSRSPPMPLFVALGTTPPA